MTSCYNYNIDAVFKFPPPKIFARIILLSRYNLKFTFPIDYLFRGAGKKINHFPKKVFKHRDTCTSSVPSINTFYWLVNFLFFKIACADKFVKLRSLSRHMLESVRSVVVPANFPNSHKSIKTRGLSFVFWFTENVLSWHFLVVKSFFFHGMVCYQIDGQVRLVGFQWWLSLLWDAYDQRKPANIKSWISKKNFKKKLKFITSELIWS